MVHHNAEYWWGIHHGQTHNNPTNPYEYTGETTLSKHAFYMAEVCEDAGIYTASDENEYNDVICWSDDDLYDDIYENHDKSPEEVMKKKYGLDQVLCHNKLLDYKKKLVCAEIHHAVDKCNDNTSILRSRSTNACFGQYFYYKNFLEVMHYEIKRLLNHKVRKYRDPRIHKYKMVRVFDEMKLGLEKTQRVISKSKMNLVIGEINRSVTKCNVYNTFPTLCVSSKTNRYWILSYCV